MRIYLSPKFSRFLALAVREKIERLTADLDVAAGESDRCVEIVNDLLIYKCLFEELSK